VESGTGERRQFELSPPDINDDNALRANHAASARPPGVGDGHVWELVLRKVR
jgi:hypothetical protein